MISPKPCIVVKGMNNRRAVATRDEEEMANAGAHVNQVPPLEEVVIGDHVLLVLPMMKDGEIRSNFLNLAQAMTSQDNIVTSTV